MPDRPHIIYVLSDEHRGQAMSHAGDPNVKTPVMDRMATEGASFARAYANCPVCTPSRGTIFSGRHAHCGPVGGFFDNYKASAPSTAHELRKAGYHTAYFGKWHMGTVHDQVPPGTDKPSSIGLATQRTPERHRAGFQDWHGFENLNQHFASFVYINDDKEATPVPGYETDGLTDMVLEYLEGYDRDEPLFLVLSVTPPHFPLIVPDEWKRFAPDELEVPGNFAESAEMREALATYYAMIENLDHNIGRLLNKLNHDARYENTLTVYFSDHGDFMGSHGLHNTKEHPQEESVRIPAIFHWPEQVPAQGLVEGLFSLVDLQGTVLGLVGIDVPSYDQGTDWSPMLRGESFTGPDAVLLEMEGNPNWHLYLRDWRGLVTERWKYAFYETGEEVLFDLHADPCEQHNLVRRETDTRNQLQRQLLDMLRATRDPYFDVLIEHGTPPDQTDIDVSDGSRTARYVQLQSVIAG